MKAEVPQKKKKVVGHFLFNGLRRSELRYLYRTAKIDSAKCYNFCEKMPGRQSLLRVYGRYNYILFFLLFNLHSPAYPERRPALKSALSAHGSGKNRRGQRTALQPCELPFPFFFFRCCGGWGYCCIYININIHIYIYINIYMSFWFFLLLFSSTGYEKSFA